jgi:hypothetical protein
MSEMGLTKFQPISVDDVVEYLVRSINTKETEGRDFDIGGAEVLTYLHMMKRYAKMLHKSIRIIIIIPFLTPRLSSYWVDLITPVKASLARPLIDSLKHEATVKDDTIKKLIPIRLKTFEEAIKAAEEEEYVKRKIAGRQQQVSPISLPNKILIVSLFAMAVIGSTYYMLDTRAEVFQIHWVFLSAVWFLSIAFSLFFVFKGTRLGAIAAGTIGWITFTFWLVDIYTVYANSLIATSPNIIMTLRNFVGAAVAATVIAASHSVYHKLRVYGI